MPGLSSSATIVGLDEFIDALAELVKTVDDSELEDALWDGAEVVLSIAKDKAPKRTGELAASGYIITPKRDNFQPGPNRRGKTKAETRAAKVAFSARYAHLVEYGTKTHRVGPETRLAVQPAVGELRAYANPRGAAPHPFLRPAFDENRGRVADAIADAIRGRMEGSSRGP